MKVCLVSPKSNFDNRSGKGTQRYIYELWHNLSSLAPKRSVEVDKIAPGFGSTENASKVTFTLSIPFNSFSGYDLIHLPSPILFPPPIKGKAKIVTTATEFVLISPKHPYSVAIKEAEGRPEFKESPISTFITESCIRQALSSDYLLVISSLIKEEAIAKGFKKENIYVTNLGVDPRFSAAKSQAKEKNFIVGYLGALNVRKNVKFAIKAFKLVKGDGIEFHIWGRGSELDNLKQQSSSDKRIKLLGFAPEDKIVDIYDGFDVMVYPILYTGFELEILEAQARGVPVIVYKHATIPKEVRKYCIDAEDEEHMSRLIADIRKDGYDKKRRSEAMKYAKSFTWQRCAEDTITAYKDIMKKESKA